MDFKSGFSDILDKPEGRKTILQVEYGTEIPAQTCLKLFKAHGVKFNVTKFTFKILLILFKFLFDPPTNSRLPGKTSISRKAPPFKRYKLSSFKSNPNVWKSILCDV